MRLSERDFLAHVAAHAGGTDMEAVRAATHAALSVTGAYLTRPVRELIATELCPALGEIVVRGEAGTALPIAEHVLTPEMTIARADELVASVFTVLAEELSDEMLTRLQRELPARLAHMLNRPAPSSVQPALARETLAEGRPGSTHPVSEARADRSQDASVASDNPHADAKLSSAAEDDRETLATGRGSTRPLSDARAPSGPLRR
jgi:uncharacterized protein (DUF2267 family)